MCAIQVTIAVYHLWLNPYAEAHAKLVYTSNQAVEAIWELLRINGPVAETGVIVVTCTKPAIVNHEYLNAELCSLFSKDCLVVLIDIETCRLPRVELMTSRPAPTFEHELSWTKHDLFNLRLRSPPSVEISKTIAFPRWHPPVRRECLLKNHGAVPSGICELNPTFNHIMTIIDP